jgi:hypothetical protein
MMGSDSSATCEFVVTSSSSGSSCFSSQFFPSSDVTSRMLNSPCDIDRFPVQSPLQESNGEVVLDHEHAVTDCAVERALKQRDGRVRIMLVERRDGQRVFPVVGDTLKSCPASIQCGNIGVSALALQLLHRAELQLPNPVPDFPVDFVSQEQAYEQGNDENKYENECVGQLDASSPGCLVAPHAVCKNDAMKAGLRENHADCTRSI